MSLVLLTLLKVVSEAYSSPPQAGENSPDRKIISKVYIPLQFPLFQRKIKGGFFSDTGQKKP
jgi:hypothetical protein